MVRLQKLCVAGVGVGWGTGVWPPMPWARESTRAGYRNGHKKQARRSWWHHHQPRRRPLDTLCGPLAILGEGGLETEQRYSSAVSRPSAPSRHQWSLRSKKPLLYLSQPEITRLLTLQYCPVQAALYGRPQVTQCELWQQETASREQWAKIHIFVT